MVRAGVLAAEAGFDGMDFKLCHDHLTNRLLMRSNTRKDKWGGATLEERCQWIIPAFENLRKNLLSIGKDDFVIGSRISENNLLDLKTLICMLDKDCNLDFISVSTYPDFCNVEALSILCQFARLTSPDITLIQSGFSERLANDGDSILAMKQALHSQLCPDFVGFGRQTVADPLTPMKLKSGNENEINWCTRCGACFVSPDCAQYG
jgi:2,4-dienoyl-CoA reductase-like NADH-dependent reductase (Old Yellow Enzyme family)